MNKKQVLVRRARSPQMRAAAWRLNPEDPGDDIVGPDDVKIGQMVWIEKNNWVTGHYEPVQGKVIKKDKDHRNKSRIKVRLSPHESSTVYTAWTNKKALKEYINKNKKEKDKEAEKSRLKVEKKRKKQKIFRISYLIPQDIYLAADDTVHAEKLANHNKEAALEELIKDKDVEASIHHLMQKISIKSIKQIHKLKEVPEDWQYVEPYGDDTGERSIEEVLTTTPTTRTTHSDLYYKNPQRRVWGPLFTQLLNAFSVLNVDLLIFDWQEKEQRIRRSPLLQSEELAKESILEDLLGIELEELMKELSTSDLNKGLRLLVKLGNIIQLSEIPTSDKIGLSNGITGWKTYLEATQTENERYREELLG